MAASLFILPFLCSDSSDRYIHLQRKYFGEEVELLEKEKLRIARDLHDEVGPLLGLTKAHINQVKPKDEGEGFHIQKANENLMKLVERMGQIAINITPGSLSKKGLRFGLEQFFDDITGAYRVKIVFKYEVEAVIDLNRSLHLYRIVQELTHNTLKHAQATQLYIHFKERRQVLYLFYSDNGRGFDAGAKQERDGIGSGSVRNRCEILHGQMRFHSKKNKGSEYFFEFLLR